MASSVSLSECGSTSVPITSPRFVLAPLAEVDPVPPSPTANVPVIELAERLTAISVDSIVSPPLAFRSTESVLPDLSIPFPAMTCPAPEN